MSKLPFNIPEHVSMAPNKALNSVPIRKLLESVRKLHGDERSQESKRQSYLEWLLRGEKAK